ncbi:helix-turn-helix domain-containing protein, partial [Anaerotignum faecicola]
LQNIIEYCVNVTNRSILTSEDLPIDFIENKREPIPEALLHLNGHAEQKIILEMLNHYGWGVEQKKIIAKKLNMSLRTLYRKIQKYQIEPTFKENNSSEQ